MNPEPSQELPLVGRQAELDELGEHLSEAQAGVASTVLVGGEAGIGKSRLIHELCERASEAGCRVLRGRADDLDRRIPYSVLRQVLESRLTEDLRAGGVPPARVLLDTLELVDSGVDPSTSNDHLSTFCVGVLQVVQQWSRRSPLVLVFDDLHAADAESLAVFSFLVRHLDDAACLLIAGFRPHPPDATLEFSALVERLAGTGQVASFDLTLLDRDATGRLAAGLLGAAPVEDFLDDLHARSRGNPFFLEECIRSYREANVVSQSEGQAWVRDGGRVALSTPSSVLLRVFRLGQPARDIARILTAFQRIPIRQLPLVSRLVGVEQSDVDLAFDDLVRANVLRPIDGGFEFVHPLIRDTLYADLGVIERRRVHGAIASVLVDERGAGGPVSVLELATHVAESALPGDEAAAAVLIEAAVASQHSAPVSAAEWFGRAIAYLPETDRRRSALLTSQAKCLLVGSRYQEAAVVARAAMESDPLGQAASILISALTSLGDLVRALAIADHAIATQPEANTSLRLQRVTLLLYLGRCEAAEEDAAVILDAATDEQTRVLAIGRLAAAAFVRGNLDRCMALLEDQLRRADAVSPEARLAVMSTRSSYLSLTGRTRQASDSIAAAHALARQLHGATLVPDLTVAEVFVDWLSGRWDAALVRARRATLDASRGHELFTMPLLRAVEASIETDRGNLSVARAICEEAYLRTAFGATFLAWAAAGVDLASGDLDGARSRLLDALAVEREQGRVSSTLLILYRLIEVERKADRQEGNRWLDELEDACDATESPWAEVRRLRARAFLNGDLDAAAKSVTIAEQEGFPFEAAVTRVLSPAPDEAIGDELRRAYETFRSLDADPWRRRAAAELRVRGLPVPRARRRSIDGLSETELRIASLVRDGMSNREISGMLHFSPKTVEHYLTTIYRRTGCAGRLELALAFQRGTLDLGGSD